MEKHRGRKMRQKRRGCEKEIEMQRHKNMKGDRGTSGGGGAGGERPGEKKKERENEARNKGEGELLYNEPESPSAYEHL